MKIESKLILASKNAVTGVNLYTFVLTYPRMILAEVNTHRMLSRNAASSRAIPAKKQRKQVLEDPFVPVYVGQNQKGMQAGQELTGWKRFVVEHTWLLARYPAVLASWILDKQGAHKQAANRIVEPWTYTQQVLTCTDLKNFFKLRNHPDAEPHFQIIAKQMQAQVEFAEKWFEILSWNGNTVYERSLEMKSGNVGTMQVLKPGEWHLPFITESDIEALQKDIDKEQEAYEETLHPDVAAFKLRGLKWETLKQISTARCARVSYFLPEDGVRSYHSRDMELCNRLSSSGHWSPFEHVATPVETTDYIGNFRSWKQYRKEFEKEHGGDR